MSLQLITKESCNSFVPYSPFAVPLEGIPASEENPLSAILNRIPTWSVDADEEVFPEAPAATTAPAWLTAVISERSEKAVPARIIAVQAERAVPPVQLRNKPFPEWTTAERRAYEPAGQVWDRDRQRWIAG